MQNRYTYVAVAAITVLAALTFGATLVHALWYAPDIEVALPAASTTPAVKAAIQTATSGDSPARLIIPSLGVNANVQHVGVAASGHMAVPTNFTDVAWYKYGPVPGAWGSAVMDGHVDNGLGLDGVFKHLSDIKTGDQIQVVSQDGTTRTFAVSDIEIYPYQDVPLQQVFNQTDTARLTLITCDGSWVQGDKTYNERLVVYAKLV